MLEYVQVGVDTFGEGFEVFNRNTAKQFINFEYLNGNLIITKDDLSQIVVSIPLDGSNRILTEVGTITIGTSPSFATTVTPLSYQYNSNVYTITNTTAIGSLTSNNTSLNRIDILYVNTTTNTIQRRSGVAALKPVMPNLNSNEILVGAIYRTPFNASAELIYSCFQSQQDQILINSGKSIVNLDDLTDVAITNPVDNQVLTWDSVNNVWKNETLTVNATIDYIKSFPTNTTVGGLEAGTTLNETDFRGVLDKMLFAYIEPVTGINTSTLLFEAGYATDVLINYNIVLNSATLSTRILYHNNVLTLSTTANNGSYNYTNLTYQNALISGESYQHTFSYQTEFDDSDPQSANLTVKFVIPVYYGSLSVINAVNIQGLTYDLKLKSDSNNLIFNPNQNKMIFSYMDSWGNLTDIIDQNGFSVLNRFSYSTMNFTLNDLSVVQMKVYQMIDVTEQTNYALNFKF